MRHAGLVLGVAILLLAATTALLTPVLYPGDPLFAHAPPMQAPSRAYPFGTDYTGRDVAAMLVWGTRVSLLFALGAAGISFAVGVVLGAVSGYAGGLVDDAMSRMFEMFYIIPRLFLIILVIALFGSHLWMTVVVVGATIWPSNARIMRAQVLTLKRRGYAQAAIVAGGSPMQVLFGHVVPNGLSPVVANSVLQMAYAVLTEAGLSFLGLGDPNVASWGQVLFWGQGYVASAPWMVIFPGLALSLLLLSFQLLGNQVQRLADPRLQALHA